MSNVDPNRPPLDLRQPEPSEKDRINNDRFPFGVSQSKNATSALSQFFSDFFANLGRKISTAAASFFGFKTLISSIKAHIKRSDLPLSHSNHNDLAPHARESVSKLSSKTVKEGVETNNREEEETEAEVDLETIASDYESTTRNQSTTASTPLEVQNKNTREAMRDVVKELQENHFRKRLSESGESVTANGEPEGLDLKVRPDIGEGTEAHFQKEEVSNQENIQDGESPQKTLREESGEKEENVLPKTVDTTEKFQTLDIKQGNVNPDENIPQHSESASLQESQVDAPVLTEELIRRKHNELVEAYIEVYTKILTAKTIIEELSEQPKVMEIIKQAVGEDFIHFESIETLFNDQLKVMEGIKNIFEKKGRGEVITPDVDINVAAQCIKNLVMTNLMYKGYLSHLAGMQENITSALQKIDAEVGNKPKLMVSTRAGEKEVLSKFTSERFIVLVQRVALLPVTLKEVIKNTPQNHSSENVLSEAFTKAKEVARIVNEGGRGEKLFAPKNKGENKARLKQIRAKMPTFAEYCQQNGLAKITDDKIKAGELQQKWRKDYSDLATIIDYSETKGAPEQLITEVCSKYVLEVRNKQQSVQWYALALHLPSSGVDKVKNVRDRLEREEKRNSLSREDHNKLLVFRELIHTRELLLSGKL